MNNRILGLFALFLCASVASAQSSRPSTAASSEAPRLVVVISVDQMRGDYLSRFYASFLPARDGQGVGGLRFLLGEGANYPNAFVDHFPTYTGPGHSVMLTGAPPSRNGIVGNGWYDRSQRKGVYCVEDPSAKNVAGSGAGGVSARMLLTTTVGDELKLATARKAKVVGIAYKDRAAILMAGHLADAVIWLDDHTGRWQSSTAYCPDGKLPAWVEELNGRSLMEEYRGKSWEALPEVAKAEVTMIPVQDGVKVIPGFGKQFPHPLEGPDFPENSFYKLYASSGLGNAVVISSAIAAVEGANLGGDPIPDLLTINLSTNDYVGHMFGPNSPEVMDVTLRTDRELSRFFRFLDKKIGLDRVVIALTADHGVAPIPADLAAQGLRAGQIPEKEIIAAIEKALGPGALESLDDPQIYLNAAKATANGRTLDQAASLVARELALVPGVQVAYTREQILRGEIPADQRARIVNGFHLARGGDLVLVTEPNFFLESGGASTTHGTLFGYDRQVPMLVYGKGLSSGTFQREVTTLDLAPTLSQVLGIGLPSGCTGSPLTEVLTALRR